MIQALEDHARVQPEAIALTSPSTSLTDAELYQRAVALAEVLAKRLILAAEPLLLNKDAQYKLLTQLSSAIHWLKPSLSPKVDLLAAWNFGLKP